MHIELGQDVYSSDNHKVGTVHRLVLNPETKDVESVVFRGSFPSMAEHLVDLPNLMKEGHEGIVLRMTQAEVEQLPPFIEAAYVRPEPDEIAAYGPAATPIGGTILYPAGPPAGSQGVAPSLFEVPPPPEGGEPAPHSDVPSNEVVIGEGTDIYSADGKKLGEVEEVFSNEQGDISGIVIRSGFIVHHKQRIPVDWIAEIGEEHIRLKLPADEVAARSNAPGQHGNTGTPAL